jgi:hypothetical protein
MGLVIGLDLGTEPGRHMMKVLVMYRFFINASSKGIPDSSAYPNAAERPESGTGTTIALSDLKGAILAKLAPSRLRTS